MAAEILREFLVGLGYKVDTSSERAMTDSVAAMTVQSQLLAKGIEKAAFDVTNFISKIAQQFEQLYYMSRRTNDGVENINAFGYAISQMGGTVEGARSSLEGLAKFLRSGPGAAGMLKSIGVDVQDATGKLRGMSSIMTDMARRFREMPYYRAQAYASILGIDERTLQAMINDTGKFSDEYHSMAQRIGFDSDKAAAQFRYFEQRYRALGEAINLIMAQAGAQLAKPLGDAMEELRQLILENSDDIVKAITFIAKTVIFMAQTLIRMVRRSIQAFKDLRNFWNSLPADFQKAVLAIVGIAVAFRILNSAISAGPIGIILRIAGALLLLYDDYKTWKETGGKGSLIDWGKWGPELEKAWTEIKHVGTAINDMVQSVGGWIRVAEAFLAYMSLRWVVGIVSAVTRATGAMALAGTSSVSSVISAAAGISGALLRFGGPVAAFIAAMTPTTTASKEMDETGYGKLLPRGPGEEEGADPYGVNGASTQRRGPAPITPSNQQMMRGLGQEPPAYNMLNPKTWKYSDFTNADQLISFFKEKGWSIDQAAGLAANFKAESGYNTKIVGDNGKAYGLGQWHPDRQSDFERLFQKKIQDSTWQEQAEFADWELRNREHRAGNQLLRAGNAREAGEAGVAYERPVDRIGARAVRGAEATRLADAYRSAHPQAASAEINQQNTITVNGAHNPQVTGQEVQNAMSRVNADLLRNAKGAVQ